MLYDLAAIVQGKDVHASPIGISRPALVAVQDHLIFLSDHAHEVDMLAGIIAGHAFEVFDESFFPIRDHRVVLDVFVITHSG